MSGVAYIPPRCEGRRYEAVLRLSEALSLCAEPEDLTKILSEELREFLAFLQFYIIIYKENSTEVEWAVVGRLRMPMCRSISDHRGRRTRRRNRTTFMTGGPMKEYRRASN
jgi:hypothetical protein